MKLSNYQKRKYFKKLIDLNYKNIESLTISGRTQLPFDSEITIKFKKSLKVPTILLNTHKIDGRHSQIYR